MIGHGLDQGSAHAACGTGDSYADHGVILFL
jgi:hypothetical protein